MMKADAIRNLIQHRRETWLPAGGTCALAEEADAELTALEAENANLRAVVPKLPDAVVLVDESEIQYLLDNIFHRSTSNPEEMCIIGRRFAKAAGFTKHPLLTSGTLRVRLERLKEKVLMDRKKLREMASFIVRLFNRGSPGYGLPALGESRLALTLGVDLIAANEIAILCARRPTTDEWFDCYLAALLKD